MPTSIDLTIMDDSIGSSELGRMCQGDEWLKLLLSCPSQSLVSNVKTKWAALRIGNLALPVTINSTEYDNSYVCSPYTGCVLYPRSEVYKLKSRVLRTAILGLVHFMAPVLRIGSVNRVVCINNWLVSTNLYPPIDGQCVEPLTQMMTKRFPDHAVAFRSLNPVTNFELILALEKAGYLMAPSRQVYFFDGRNADYMRLRDTRVDRKFLEQSPYRVIPHEELTSNDAARIQYLYQLLYVNKHSQHNPQMTVEMIDKLRSGRLWTMWGLKDKSGRLDGIIGAFFQNGVMSAPMVGYDTALPKKVGLYRMLTSIVMEEAAKRHVTFNASSGAASFKRLRGAQPSIEFMAVYCKHLPWKRRMIWKLLASLLNNVGAPILRKYEL